MTPQEQLIAEVAPHLHAGQHVDAARLIAKFSGEKPKQAEDQPLYFANALLHWSLNADRYDLAAKLIWPSNIFTPEPREAKMVWDALRRSATVLLLGGASMSKSYSAGVWLFLDWIRDPEFTTIRVVGPSEEHLKSNLFTHLVTLHKEASIPLPGMIGDLFIGLDRKQRRSSIQGVVIPLGRAGSGKLQGTKRTPRKTAHPVFGVLTRLRVFLDETEKIPAGVWRDVDNIFANITGVEGFKIVGACNPEDRNGPTGQRSMPPGGWEKFDPETDDEWKSERGWDVVRLDPFKSENVVTGRTLYAGLQTKEGLERLIQNAGGTNSPSYWTFARGCFPPQGVTFSVINATTINGVAGEFIYRDKPNKVAAVDLALEGGDAPKMAIGRFGLAIGVKHPSDYETPNGREEIFSKPQWGLQMDQLFSLPSCETVRMAGNIKQQCQSLGVDPNWLLLDRTGNGAGVHDLLKTLWSPEVRGVNYSEAASEKKIFDEDSQTCKEEFDRVTSELWFAMARWLEFKLVRISPVVETEKLFPQLTSRLYMPGKTRRVESKRDYKSRGNESPNEADAFTLLLHAARMASGAVPSMSKAGTSGYHDHEDPMPFIVGATDRLDSL